MDSTVTTLEIYEQIDKVGKILKREAQTRVTSVTGDVTSVILNGPVVPCYRSFITTSFTADAITSGACSGIP